MSFRQLINSRILVEEQDVPYEGRIILPPNAKKERGIRRGVVLQMGPGILMADGSHFPMPECKVGDLVLFYFDSGVAVTFANGQKRLVIRGEDVVAVMEQEEKEAAE